MTISEFFKEKQEINYKQSKKQRLAVVKILRFLKRYLTFAMKFWGQLILPLVTVSATAIQEIAVTLRARDYKGLDNYGSNGVIEWKN